MPNKSSLIQNAKKKRNIKKRLMRSNQAIAAQPGLKSPNKEFVSTLLNIHEGNVDETIHSIKSMIINKNNKKILTNLVNKHTHNIQVNTPRNHNNRQGVPRPPPPPGPRPPPRNVNNNVQRRIVFFNKNLPEGWEKVTTQNGRNTYRTYSGDEKYLTEQSNWNVHIHPLAKVGTKYVNRQFINGTTGRVLRVPMIGDGDGDSYYDILVNLKRRQNQTRDEVQRTRNHLARVDYIKKVKVLVNMFLKGLQDSHDLYNNSGSFKQKNMSSLWSTVSFGMYGKSTKSSKNTLLEGIKLINKNKIDLTPKLINVLENGRNFIEGNTTSNETFRKAKELAYDIEILNLNDVNHLLYNNTKHSEISQYIMNDFY